jgi:hypothetical protein
MFIILVEKKALEFNNEDIPFQTQLNWAAKCF